MARRKIVLDDFFEEVSFSLIAIHSSLEDFRLAYSINRQLQFNLTRKEDDIDIDYASSSYSIFEWEDIGNLVVWNLVNNVCLMEEQNQSSAGSLFGDIDKALTTHNLLSEHKNVDYLLKTSSCDPILVNRTISKILEIPNVVAAYPIEVSSLRSRTNLIFS